MSQFVYADNAATTALDEYAYEAMKPYLLSEYGNPSQPYSFSRAAKKALKDARETISSCIGALPEEIVFTSGGTESDNWAIKGNAFLDPEKRATITSSIEHHAVLNSCYAIERLGYPVAYLPVSHDGLVEPDTLTRYITEKTRLVSVMTVNNEIGTIQPIQKLAEISHQYDAVFHTDAVQAVGHTEIDVQSLGIDLLSASAHKFNGPRGIGFLYVRTGTRLASLLDGGQQEYGMRAGTENVAAIVGMAAALKTNVDEMEHNRKHVSSLENQLLCALQTNGVEFIRNGSNCIPGILSLSFPGANAEALLHRLDLASIVVSTGAACDSKKTQVSHVLQAIDLPAQYAKGTIRISLGKQNTVGDITMIANIISKIMGTYKNE